VGAAFVTWIIAAALVWLVAPLPAANPAVAQPAQPIPPIALALPGAVSALVLFVGVAVNWFAPRRAVGRAVVLIGGLMVAMSAPYSPMKHWILVGLA
jgi:hypothetical protein